MTRQHALLLISGSLRRRSTNTAVLRTAQAQVPPGTSARLLGGLAELPHFNPDDDGPDLHERVASLREQIRAADALVFSTPEYAGALPGSFKNLLDWSIGDEQVGSIYEKPVCWINASPRGARQAHDELRTVLHYAHALIVEDACIHVPVTASSVGADGLVAEPGARELLSNAMGHLVARLERES